MIESLGVFSTLDKGKLSMIMDVVDESIVKSTHRSRVKDRLRRMGFAPAQSGDIAECFFNFYLALHYPDELKEWINKANVNEYTKQLIMETFEEILAKGNKDAVAMTEKSDIMALFGHKHLHGFGVTSEFRPILDDHHKLQKMVVSVVIEGYTHDGGSTAPTPLNFQMRLDEFENFVRMLNKQLEDIRMEVKVVKEKLGGDVVDV